MLVEYDCMMMNMYVMEHEVYFGMIHELWTNGLV